MDVGERRRRNNILRILSQKKKHLFYESSLNKTVNVLFESENANGIIKGFSSEYIRVAMPYNESLVNRITPVEISGIDGEYCTGKREEKIN